MYDWERIFSIFLYQIFPALVLYAALLGYFRLIVPKFIPLIADAEKNSEQLKEYGYTHLKQIIFSVLLPTTLLFAPVLEELLFRDVPVLLFDRLSEMAWVGIVASAALFSFTHRNGNFIVKSVAKAEGVDVSPRQRVAALISSFVLGIVCGWVAIKNQSLWYAIGTHFLWNLLLPVAGGIVWFCTALLFIIYEKIRDLFHALSWKERNMARRRTLEYRDEYEDPLEQDWYDRIETMPQEENDPERDEWRERNRDLK